jgi:hypothetical protein
MSDLEMHVIHTRRPAPALLSEASRSYNLLLYIHCLQLLPRAPRSLQRQTQRRRRRGQMILALLRLRDRQNLVLRPTREVQLQRRRQRTNNIKSKRADPP